MPLPRPALPAAGLAAALALAAVAPSGCKKTGTAAKTGSAAKALDDPWPKVALALRRETDAATCRRVLGQLGTDLAVNPGAEQPPKMTPEAEAAAPALLHLSDEDLGEVRSGAYTPLDAAHLAECFYLRDAARALEVGGRPPARQAGEAFAWVCRQVELRPWVGPDPQTGEVHFLPPVPPAYVLRRGSGSGLERALVFIALLDQIGLDSCLIGPPDAADKPWHHAPDKAEGPPKGPFWAVGARAGGDILLFDPWRGEAAPGAGTLAGAKADPASLKPWGVPGDAVTAAVPFLAVPLSAAAPRMRLLEEKLKAEAPVRLGTDPAALAARFAAETKTPAPAYWSPAADAFSPTQVLATFLPLTEGGRDNAPEGGRLLSQYRAAQVPFPLFRLPPGVASAVVRDRLRAGVAGAYDGMFLTPPTPRELVQRGQVAEATRQLVGKRELFAAGVERAGAGRPVEAVVREWVGAANDAYARLGRAQLDKDPAAVAAADEGVQKFWATQQQGLSAAVVVAAGDAGLAEATYLLALAKHEQAEAAEDRYEAARAAGGAGDQFRDKAKDAWAEAAGWWGRYEPFAGAQDKAFPGRADHAKRLADRANKAGEQLGK